MEKLRFQNMVAEQKVWEKISDAFNNKVNIQGNRWQGITSDGIKIEMRLDTSGNISTAYIIK